MNAESKTQAYNIMEKALGGSLKEEKKQKKTIKKMIKEAIDAKSDPLVKYEGFDEIPLSGSITSIYEKYEKNGITVAYDGDDLVYITIDGKNIEDLFKIRGLEDDKLCYCITDEARDFVLNEINKREGRIKEPQEAVYEEVDASYNKLIVHGGVFHADDVLCAAVAKELYPDIEIERTFKVTDEMIADPNVLICDIGKQYDPEYQVYDHHNDCPNIEGTDVKSSAIGLMLNDVRIRDGLESMNSKMNEPVVKDMLKTIQAMDNGITMEYNEVAATLSKAISSSNPVWDSKENPNDKFNKAVQFAMQHFVEPCIQHGELGQDDIKAINDLAEKNDIIFEESKERAAAIVKDALENHNENGVVTLPQYAPWDDILVPAENATFVIYPSNRGGYNLQCVPPELESFDKKLELPDWSENKPEGMTFEHPGRFLASFETLEQAQNAAGQVIKQACSGKDLSVDDTPMRTVRKSGVASPTAGDMSLDDMESKQVAKSAATDRSFAD